MAQRLDHWDTDGLFTAEGNAGLLWLILGLARNPRDRDSARFVFKKAAGQSFNRLTRVFWVHMLFDALCYHCGLDCGPRKPVVADHEALKSLQNKEGVKPVCDLVLLAAPLLAWNTIAHRSTALSLAHKLAAQSQQAFCRCTRSHQLHECIIFQIN